MKTVPFHMARDCAPVTRGVMAPMVLAIDPGVGAGSLGELVARAVNERTPLLPGVRTIAESGFPQLAIWTSFSVLAPVGTPAAVVERLNAEIAAAMKAPVLAERLAQQALVPVLDTPAAFTAALKREREHWAAFIRRSGSEPE